MTVPLATPADLGSFRVERSNCHDNVDRWCAAHTGHKSKRGWLVTSDFILDKHSVVDRGAEGLFDITPLDGRQYTTFLIHDGTEEEFAALPNQVNVLVI